ADGIRLQRRWLRTARAACVFGRDGWPGVGAKEADAVAALEDLVDAVDAVSDVVIAEGVFEAARGGAARSGAALDAAAAAGSLPQSLEVLRSPVTGRGYTHRVVLLL